MRHHKRLIILIVVLLVLTGVIFYSPRFLTYSTEPEKADAIVILLGPDFKARKKEANELVNKRMADYLIIPAYHKIYEINDKGKRKDLSSYLKSNKFVKKNVSSYPSFYEDTHVEIIKAQKIMSGYGIKSAIFVSSPHHMRRIKLIAERVFKTDNYNFYFVPTRYENIPANFWELSSSDWKKVRREYSKIFWFIIYYTWSEFIG
ncbi:MAG: YdcF family protein [Syntrophaceae bacterium]|nr:YdcF family protein [Syntrophaceae bacterium]